MNNSKTRVDYILLTPHLLQLQKESTLSTIEFSFVITFVFFSGRWKRHHQGLVSLPRQGASERGADHHGPSNATMVRAYPNNRTLIVNQSSLQRWTFTFESLTAIEIAVATEFESQHWNVGQLRRASPLLEATKTNFSCLDMAEDGPAMAVALLHLASNDDEDAIWVGCDGWQPSRSSDTRSSNDVHIGRTSCCFRREGM
ncbi:hypothetical protein PIB30_052080 [Stylosanthes scabra]|uniref:Uncharacterized protein n=1 Tax=Stylosanthes scabra TaxID=79078 RepID=A0ABU6ZGW5_9FABA|nr:hypothetical protein [Stylosanthes scabra]